MSTVARTFVHCNCLSTITEYSKSCLLVLALTMDLDNWNCRALTLLTLEVLYLYCGLWA